MSTSIPSHLLCPLSGQIMTEPVIAIDGETYDRTSILICINDKKRKREHCDFTIDELRPNASIRRLLDEYNHNSNRPSSTDLIYPHQPPLQNGTNKFMTNYYSKFNDGAVSAQNNAIIIKPCCIQTENYICVALNAVSEQKRLPVHLIAVIDRSGSMGELVTIKEINSSGEKEEVSHGFTRCDLAVQSLKILINSLTTNDFLTILSFSDDTIIHVDKLRMDSNGKNTALSRADEIVPESSTCMWQAINDAFKIAKDNTLKYVATHICLLTDGDSTDKPPNNWNIDVINLMKQSYHKCTLNVFGYSNAVKSDILQNIVDGSNGMYSFIPDGSFVTTIMVNAFANILTTCGINAEAEIIFENSITKNINIGSVRYGTVRSVIANRPTKMNSNMVSHFSSCSYSNTESYLLAISSDKFSNNVHKGNNCLNVIEVKITYVDPITYEKKFIVQGIDKIVNSDANNLLFSDSVLFDHIARQGFGEVIRNCVTLRTGTNLQEFINILQTIISKNSVLDTEFIKDLLIDATGEATLSFRNANFTTWGQHFTRSLALAHLSQTCNNFKDPGVQHYKNDLLTSLINEITNILETIPPPKPSAPKQANRAAPASSQAYASLYASSSNPCFAGSCKVKTLNGHILVQDIKVGDQVMTPNGVTEVLFVLKTLVEDPPMLRLSNTGLLVTDWHPIKINGIWQFPRNVAEFQNFEADIDAVYSFALKEHHSMFINDIECVCFGHYKEDNIVQHDYFGTNKVLQDLTKMSDQQQSNRYVTIKPSFVKKHLMTGLVFEISQK
jgi:hypothetical protein